jgi:hypothetical protein
MESLRSHVTTTYRFDGSVGPCVATTWRGAAPDPVGRSVVEVVVEVVVDVEGAVVVVVLVVDTVDVVTVKTAVATVVSTVAATVRGPADASVGTLNDVENSPRWFVVKVATCVAPAFNVPLLRRGKPSPVVETAVPTTPDEGATSTVGPVEAACSGGEPTPSAPTTTRPATSADTVLRPTRRARALPAGGCSSSLPGSFVIA